VLETIVFSALSFFKEGFMIDFDLFCDTVNSNIMHYIPKERSNITVEMVHQEKVNLGKRTGLAFREGNGAYGNTVYLENYYRSFVEGEEQIDRIMENIVKEGLNGIEASKSLDLPTHYLKSWDQARDHVFMHAIGKSRNEELLKTVPHRTWGDISCVYRIRLQGGPVISSVLVNDEMAERYGISEADLYEAAYHNMLREEPPVLTTIEAGMQAEMMRNFGGHAEADQYILEHDMLKGNGSPDDSDTQLFILTSKHMESGAGVVFIPGLIENIGRIFKNGFAVIPSSTMECLILPMEAGISAKDLKEMISDINQNEVDVQDRLSDFPLYWDSDQKRLVSVS